MRHIFSSPPYAPRIRAAIALEGCGAATVVDRALGSRRLRVEITGPGGHSWADAGRPNPITALAAALTALGRARAARQPPHHPELRHDLRRNVHQLHPLNRTGRSRSALHLLRRVGEPRKDRPLHAVEVRQGRSPARPLARRPRSAKLPPKLSFRINQSVASATAPPALSPQTPPSPEPARRRPSPQPPDGIPRRFHRRQPSALARHPRARHRCRRHGGGIHTLDEWYAPAGRELALRRILLLLLDTCASHRDADTSGVIPTNAQTN